MLSKIWNAEPIVIIGAIQALIAVGVGFGLNLTSEQTALILGAVSAVLALFGRTQVYAQDTVAKLTGGAA